MQPFRFPASSTRLLSVALSLVGMCCAQSSRAATDVSLPFTAGFEAADGYAPGWLTSDAHWDISPGLRVDVVPDAFSGTQGLSIKGGDWLTLDHALADPATGYPVSWFDFYLQPVFGAADKLVSPASLSDFSAATGFVKVAAGGEVYALDGDGNGGGVWTPSGFITGVDSKNRSTGWVRLSYRLDYSTRHWDLYLNGRMVLADLGFLDSSLTEFNRFSLRGDSWTATRLDQFSVGATNPLFTDTSGSGLPDAWLSDHGLSISGNQRYADPDRDGISNLQEYLLGLNPSNPDTDNDGLSDQRELLRGTDPALAGTYPLGSIPYSEGFESDTPGAFIDGTRLWSVSLRQDSNVEILKPASSPEGSQYLSFRGHQIHLERLFANPAHASLVWLDFQAQLASRATPPADIRADIAALFYLKTDGSLMAFDGTASGDAAWRSQLQFGSAAATAFHRFTVRLDYAAQTWSLWVDGVRRGTALGFAHPVPYFSGMEVVHNADNSKPAGLDAFNVSFTEPASLDNDGDGLTNAQELVLGTNPDLADTDGDGLPDGWEVAHGLNPTTADAALDADGDGLSNLAEYQAGTDPQKADTDGDGMPDGWELAHGLNPFSAADAALIPDGDGLTNLWKYQLGVAPGTRADRVIGGAVMETWWSINDIYVWSLTNNGRFPGSPSTRTLLTSLEAPADRADNYGDRIRGYIVPPADGDYRFWIAADDSAELWLSPTDSPFDRQRIAYVSSAVGYRAFDAREIQRSAPVALQAGHGYYFEVLHKEGGGGDHVSVAWTRPGADREIIAGQYLATFAPRADNQAGDGLPDSWKAAHGLSVTSGAGANGAYGDADDDRLTNLLEYQYDTDPSVADTDGDGFSDLIEVMAGSDPADVDSVPADLSPWSLGTVGSNVAGDAGGTVSAPGYVVYGGGWGVPENAVADDTLAMAYQTLSADFEVSAYVSDLGQGGQGALVVRSSLDPQAPAATFHVDTRGNAWFHVRPTVGATTLLAKKVIISDVNSFSHGRWLKLRRQGGVVTALYSADGQSWIQLETAKIDLPDACLAGMGSWGSTTWQFTDVSLRLDADKDGIYDDDQSSYAQQIASADPAPAGATLRQVASYAGSTGVTAAGSWKTIDGAAVSQMPKSALDFDIQVPADGVYRLELEAQSASNSTLNVIFPVELSIDGQFLGRIELIMNALQVSLGHVATPWLTTGTHRVHVYYDSTLSYRAIQINALRLQAWDGPDADGNGRADWVDSRLALIDTLVPPVSESFVSPAFIEGVTRFPTLLRVTAAGETVSSLTGPGYGWYADVPLSASGVVPVTVSFENGAITRTAQIGWKTINLLNDLAAIPEQHLRIRKGDSLLLTASPQKGKAKGKGGSAVVTITPESGEPMVLTLDAPHSTPVVHLFDSPGCYAIQGVFSPDDDPKTSGVLTVEVVEAEFNGDPIAGLGIVTTWDNPRLPADAVIDVDQGLSLTPSPLSGGGTSFKLLTANIGDSYAVSRLSEGGPILSRAVVHSLRVASNDQTAVDVLKVYPDGSKLIGVPIILSQVTPDTRVVVDIFVNGVTFEDGTIQKVFTAADFDSLGRVYVKFLYPAGLRNSFCHRIYVYQGDALVGEF